MTDKANEIIEKAIDILDDDRWGQSIEREYDDGKYRYCAVGAMRAAAGYVWNSGLADSDQVGFDSDAFTEAYRRVNVVTVRETDRHFPSIVGYNDAFGRTAEDVRLMLKKAIRT